MDWGTRGTKLSLKDGGTLQDFISRIAQGIYIVTPDGRIIDANPALLDIFGAESVEELQRYRSEDLVADPEALKERRRLLAQNGFLRDYRYEIRRLDGKVVPVRDTVFTQRDDGGQVVALHGILVELQEDETSSQGPPADEGLSSFFTGAPAGLAILDSELRFVRINRRLADMHILPVEDHLGRSLAEALPGIAPAVDPILRRVLETGSPALNLEINTEEPGSLGSVRVWRLSAFPVGPAEERPTGVGVMVVDITDAKRVEREARLDQRYLSALIESSPLAMVTVDLRGRVVSANQAFEQLFLFPRDEIVGRDLDELIDPEEERAHAQALTMRTGAGERLRSEGNRRRKDGTVIVVRIHTAPIIIDDHCVGTYGIYERVT